MSNPNVAFQALTIMSPVMALCGIYCLCTAWRVKGVLTTQSSRYGRVFYAILTTVYIVWQDLLSLGASQTVHLLAAAVHDGTHFGWLPCAFILANLAMPLAAVVTLSHVYYRPALLKRMGDLKSCRFVEPERATKEVDLHNQQ